MTSRCVVGLVCRLTTRSRRSREELVAAWLFAPRPDWVICARGIQALCGRHIGNRTLADESKEERTCSSRPPPGSRAAP